MPKSLYDGNIKLNAFSVKPANLAAVTLAELAASVELSMAVMNSGYQLGATGSDSVTEKAIGEAGNSAAFGASNFAGNLTVFRYLLSSGKSDPAADIGYNLFTGKGLTLWLAERVGPKASQAWAGTDVYDLYEVITDDPQSPSERSGYIKFVQPLGVQGNPVFRGVVAP